MSKAKITLILIFITNLWLVAQPVFTLLPSDNEISLDKKLSIFYDESSKKNLSEIQAITAFELIPYSKHSFGYVRGNNWVKTSFKYEGESTKEYNFIFKVPLTYVVEQYLLNSKNEIVATNISGCQKPFDSRSVDNRYFVLNFKPKSNETYQYYCKLHNDLGSVNASFLLMDNKTFETYDQVETFWLFAFLFLITIAFIVSVILYFVFKDTIYLYYSGYLLSVVFIRFCIFGFAFKYIHPDFPEFAAISKLVYWLSMATCFIHFVPRLLSGTNPYFTRATKIFAIQSIFYIAIIIYTLVINIFYKEYTNNMLNYYLVFAVQINYLISTAVVFAITIKSIRKKFSPSIYFSISFLPLLILMTLTTATNFRLLPNTFLSNYPLEIGITIEIFILSYALLLRYKIILTEKLSLTYRLQEIEKQMKERHFDDSPKEKYQTSKFQILELESTHHKLLSYMENEKPFLKDTISLQSLSESISVSPHLLSQVINQLEGKNFFDYINSHRVKEAQRLLLSDKYEHFSVEGIGYECGFNTKATFYTTFKKICGLTPAEYRKMSQKADSQQNKKSTIL